MERTRLVIEGSGVLPDGTPYTREVTVTETVDTEGRTRETSEETLRIGGEEVRVRGERRDGEVVWEDVQVIGDGAYHVQDGTVGDVDKFEGRWREVNWRWSRWCPPPPTPSYRMLHHHMPDPNQVL